MGSVILRKAIYLAILTVILRVDSRSLSSVEGQDEKGNKHGHSAGRFRRSPTLNDRENCNPGDAVPVTRVNTANKLTALRAQMHSLTGVSDGIQAYIIPMDDEHQSEYVAAHDERVRYVSGFSGSAGLAVITRTQSALWTDGRYFLQAENQLDCNWILMKKDEPGTPSVSSWLSEVLTAGSIVGADPAVLSYDKWSNIGMPLNEHNISLGRVSTNLVDAIWTDGSRPEKPTTPIFALNTTFSGETWQDKVARIRAEMTSRGVSAVVINFLDESAWLYNLRGEDVDYNPVFFSYSIVELDKTSLYILNAEERLQDNSVKLHLDAVLGDQMCATTSCVHVFNYEDFYMNLKKLSDDINGKVWVSPMSSYMIYATLAQDNPNKVFLAPSIVRVLKARKNPTEIQGMRNSQHRDSATLIEFMTMLESSVKAGNEWTEISAADELDHMRRSQKYNKGLSFSTISASGSNGAVIHYTPTKLTDKAITTDDMYLLDSGGQYLDGTTDVTRTFHFGTPTDFMKEAYTRVLMGVIDLAMARWPNGTYGRDIDILARQPLWSVGLDYRHGTGHGLGAFLNVHEEPGRIQMGYRAQKYESPLYGEMFFSDEPGYYEKGEFGVRLETIVMTKKVDTKYEFGGKDWLEFEVFTLVPFEPVLMNYQWLNIAQRKWLNAYNARCLQEIGEDILKPQNKMAAFEWLSVRCQHIPDDATYADDSVNAGNCSVCSMLRSVLLAMFVTVLIFC